MTPIIDPNIVEQWSDASQFYAIPDINQARLQQYRTTRLKQQMQLQDVAMLVIVNPIAMRYAINYRNYALFQTHIPSTYLFYPIEGSPTIFGAYQPDLTGNVKTAHARPICFFDGGDCLQEYAKLFARDMANYIKYELATNNRRVALEYVNPTITKALLDEGLEVVDGVDITEMARVIKSEDEISCIKWAITVAQHAIDNMKKMMQPGVTELQLWGLLNYTNITNDGDWHDGRMLASGERINPWLQEATNRVIRAGDLVGFDTDMIGPYGYFADISRTFYCGSADKPMPSKRQKQLYQLAYEEVEHNLKLIKHGVSFEMFREQAWATPEEYQTNAYSCLLHGVGMCDEYPQIKHNFKPGYESKNCYSGTLQSGMVVCVESYIGAVGESNGVKLEQQVLVTNSGYELLSTYPYEEILLN